MINSTIPDIHRCIRNLREHFKFKDTFAHETISMLEKNIDVLIDQLNRTEALNIKIAKDRDAYKIIANFGE